MLDFTRQTTIRWTVLADASVMSCGIIAYDAELEVMGPGSSTMATLCKINTFIH